jgi:hypothetical protein
MPAARPAQLPAAPGGQALLQRCKVSQPRSLLAAVVRGQARHLAAAVCVLRSQVHHLSGVVDAARAA